MKVALPVLFLLTLSVINLPISGQISLSVLVTDSLQQPIEGAIATLFVESDSALVGSSITETNGTAAITFSEVGTYFLQVVQLGYLPFIQHGIEITSNLSTPLAVVLRNEEAAKLGVVEIQSTVPFVERKVDRIVVHPDVLISNAGTNALEVLEKSPGIMVDINGIISLRGKQGVLIYIDDKPTYLAPEDLANYLKSLPSSSIATIEIMHTPPAKYDAAGNSGIINIRLKKTTAQGLNGSVNLNYGQGFYARSNNGLNFNYRINKLNIFSNFGYSYNGSYQDLTINRKYFTAEGEPLSFFDQNTYIKKQNKNANLKLGMDFYATKKSTFGLVLNGFIQDSHETSQNTAQLRDSVNTLTSLVYAFNPTDRLFRNGNINLNYTLKPDTTGKEITINADYGEFDSDLTQALVSSTYDPNNEFLGRTNLVSDLPSNIKIATAQIDYLQPVGKTSRIDAGAKTGHIETNNVADFFDEVNGILTTNADFTNEFLYKENIHAGYINYSTERNKVSIQTGLRYELTNVNGHQVGNEIRNDSTFTRDYSALFPTFYATYKIDSLGKKILGFSYGRRIDRPNYQDMNPFTYPLDRFTLYAGNPFLQPTYSHNFELSYTSASGLMLTGYYSFSNDVISETIEQEDGIFYSRPGNIGKSTTYGISMNFGLPLTKWSTLKLYTEVMQNEFTSLLYNQQLDNRGAYWYIGPTLQFIISPTWSAELSGSNQTAVNVGQFVTIPVWQVRGGVSCKILKKMGTLKLNVNDIFYTNQPGGDIKGLENSNASWFSYLDTRVYSISFGYRFMKGQTLDARTTGSAESERARVQ